MKGKNESKKGLTKKLTKSNVNIKKKIPELMFMEEQNRLAGSIIEMLNKQENFVDIIREILLEFTDSL